MPTSTIITTCPYCGKENRVTITAFLAEDKAVRCSCGALYAVTVIWRQEVLTWKCTPAEDTEDEYDDVPF